MTAVLKVSPKFDTSKLANPSFDDIVDVYEDRVRGWFLDWARELNKHEHAGFAVLQLALAYFEAYEVFRSGQSSDRRSLEFFKRAFRDVFPSVDNYGKTVGNDIMSAFYQDARNGLFHVCMTRKRILLLDGDPVFRVVQDKTSGEVQAICIDRYKLVEALENHFASYITKLRDSSQTELRKNFQTAWALTHK